MCRAIPARVTRIEGDLAWIDQDGQAQPVSLLAVDGVEPGDYVLHHAGLALARVSEDEAEEIFQALAELDALYARQGD